MERKAKTRKVRTMDAVLATMAVFLLVFVAAMLWLYRTTGGIPDTLCTCVFAACGGECGVMGWIKTTKERQRERRYETRDRLWEKAAGRMCATAGDAVQDGKGGR